MNRIRRGLLASALALLITPVSHAGMVWSANGHEYEVVLAEDVTWSHARAAALARGPGWDLATLTSAGERDFVAALLPAAPPDRSHLWLGGTDASAEGVWTWITGESWGFTNWWPSEPNDNGGAEDYLALDFRGASSAWSWNDVSADIDGRGWARGYVVERAAVPAPATLPLAAVALALLAWTRRQGRR